MSKRKIISVHTLVKNEARFIWYSVMSVYPYVDRIRIWDMGSSDYTRSVIGKIIDLSESPGKVFYDDAPMTNFDEEYARQHMLEKTVADWFIVVDADEIWWKD